MIITGLSVQKISIPLKKPFKTALRTVHQLEDVLVKIDTDTGISAWGEAPPTAAITGETIASIECAILAHLGPAIIGMDILDFEAIMLRLHAAIQGNTSAKAAVDMALYDLFSKQCGLPLYQLLGGAKATLENDITISLNPTDQMVNDSIEAVQSGYKTLKIKVGLHGENDLQSIQEIRNAVGPSIKLRIDANQSWTAKQSIKTIQKMEDMALNIELVEQPVPARDLQGLAYVTQSVDTPILADESVFSAKDAVEIIHRHAADFINIKLMKTGGIYKALELCAIADLYQVPCMIGCMLESKLSVAAAAHLAGGRSIIQFMDLDGPNLCKTDPWEGGPIFDHATIRLNSSPGIGITNLSTFQS